MKPTAVLLTVISLVISSLFFAGTFNSEKKPEPYIPDCNVLPEIPLTKEEVALPPPPDNHPGLLPTIINTEPVNSGSGVIEPTVHTIGCDLVPPNIPCEEVLEKIDSDSCVFIKVEIEAEYPGGAAAWQRFLNRNMRVPQDVIENDVQGTVVVQFVVDTVGNVSNVEAVSGTEALCAEAVRMIKKSGKWTPAVQGGRFVRSLRKQPFMIHFIVEE